MKQLNCIRLEADLQQITACKQTLQDFDFSFNLLANAFNLVGNPVRLKILFLLWQEKHLCVCDLSDVLNMKVAAISQHLRKLKDRQMIVPSRDAQTIYYSLTKEYKQLFEPFFIRIKANNILETV